MGRSIRFCVTYVKISYTGCSTPCISKWVTSLFKKLQNTLKGAKAKDKFSAWQEHISKFKIPTIVFEILRKKKKLLFSLISCKFLIWHFLKI